MKKQEIIELNGQEYTLTFNRESYIKIDQYSNIKNTFRVVNSGLYDYIDEITDEDNPFEKEFDFEAMDLEIERKENIFKRMITRGFYILLYPEHQLKISEVEQLLKPYFGDEEKEEELSDKFGECLAKCIQIRNEYNEERKNLKAQANK